MEFDNMIQALKSSGCFLEQHISKILEINGVKCLRSLSLIGDNEIAAMELDMRSVYADRDFFDKLDDVDKELMIFWTTFQIASR